jgi:hypothetical protein
MLIGIFFGLGRAPCCESFTALLLGVRSIDLLKRLVKGYGDDHRETGRALNLGKIFGM